MENSGLSETAKSDDIEKLKVGLSELTRRHLDISTKEYRREMLVLFAEAGLDITGEELDMLLLLRQRTN